MLFSNQALLIGEEDHPFKIRNNAECIIRVCVIKSWMQLSVRVIFSEIVDNFQQALLIQQTIKLI